MAGARVSVSWGLKTRILPPPRSLPGLVEEDVPRLRVLGDVRGESIKLLNSLGVDFLPDTQKVTLQG